MTSLAKIGLPTAAIAQLNSAISGLSSGLVKVTTPQVGENTTDRTQIDSQTNALIGNAPPPNFKATVAPEPQSNVKTPQQKVKEIKAIDERYAAQKKVAFAARDEFLAAKQNLPAGDPQIAELQLKAQQEALLLAKINSEYATVY